MWETNSMSCSHIRHRSLIISSLSICLQCNLVEIVGSWANTIFLFSSIYYLNISTYLSPSIYSFSYSIYIALPSLDSYIGLYVLIFLINLYFRYFILIFAWFFLLFLQLLYSYNVCLFFFPYRHTYCTNYFIELSKYLPIPTISFLHVWSSSTIPSFHSVYIRDRICTSYFVYALWTFLVEISSWFKSSWCQSIILSHSYIRCF